MRLNPRDPRLLLLMLLISVAVVAGCKDSGTSAGAGSESKPLVSDENTDLVTVSVTGAT
jgi:hypothetical protein